MEIQETIVNSNILLGKRKKYFLTENKKVIYQVSRKLKSEVIHHNNFIVRRYSFLQVGMLPAQLMLKSKKFRRFNFLMKDKDLLILVQNVSGTLY